MESTGVPEKIQISESFKNGLHKHYPEYKTAPRGSIEIKVELNRKIYKHFLNNKSIYVTRRQGKSFWPYSLIRLYFSLL